MSISIRKPASLFILSLLCGLMMSQPAWADDDDDPAKIAEMAKTFGLISLEDAQKKALAAKPGMVKEAELENRKFKSGWDYEFEIVDADGKEWEVLIDAKTGKVNSVNRDWF
ncbi:PepSY domain-containing protein [Methylophilus aquaticus]|uniref:PepSY domain-containing protein n=1 Tax=Methylophilus aquaticus TaxID=1971610 RepID=A0ABT9JRQ3_9PROT|nr:PepSY domain-containing protein [Methylophilus aquaticus]MDP8567229.1 PepSY domain-containing protein [Methylophilus aquaticus]